MSTWRYICNDITTTLKQINASSDLSLSQVQYWVSTIANRLRYQHIAKTPTGRFLSIYTGIPVQSVGTSANPNVVKNRKLIVLPTAVYDYISEKGISYLCHSQDASCPPEFMNLYFQPTTPSKAQRLGFSPYEKPSAKNPYFYRVKNIVYLLGLEATTVYSLEMGLYTAIEMNTNLVSLDDECDLTEQHLTMLRTELLQLGAFAYAIPKDRANDATDIVDQSVKVKPVATPQSQQQ